jgi:hypothetical protein
MCGTARSICCQELFSQRCCVTYTARCIEVILTVGGRQQSISGDHRAHGRMDEQTEGGGHRLRQTLPTLICHPGLLLDWQCVLRTVQYVLKY